MGAAGKVNQAIVDEVLAGPYFVHDIPKTTGRETFGDTLAEELCERMLAQGATPEDCVATITRITAQSLAEGYKRWGPKGGIDEIYLGGGGSYNPNIVNYLRQQFPKTKIEFLDVIGIPTGGREAMAFAYNGLECIVGRSLVVPKNVESDRAGIIGHIQPGAGVQWHGLMKKVQEFWADWPIEKRMDPVLQMEIVGNEAANGVNGAH
jgi:1,6-anhydro-N-acetylmuramate kinase